MAGIYFRCFRDRKEAGVAVGSGGERKGCVLRYEHGGRQVYVK